MNKIRVIDLLNKIANGDMPEHIKFDTDDWYWGYDSYIPKGFIDTTPDVQAGVSLFKKYRIDYCLNEEIEIIEEPKKIEKLGYIKGSDLVDLQKNSTLEEQAKAVSKLLMVLNEYRKKINEIIEKINKEVK